MQPMTIPAMAPPERPPELDEAEVGVDVAEARKTVVVGAAVVDVDVILDDDEV